MEAETIIPIVAIVGAFSIPITWFYFDSRNRRDRTKVVEKALETGTDPEVALRALGKPSTPTIRRPFRRGLVLLAIGAALLLSYQLGYTDHGDHEGQVFGIILSFLGLAFLIGDLLDRGGNGSSSE